MKTILISGPISSPAGPPQPGPPGRHLGHYPSLPPGYQQTSAPHNATSPMHPAMQGATQPYTQAPQPYQQVRGMFHQLTDCVLLVKQHALSLLSSI